MSAQLVVISGQLKGAAFALEEGEISIGREASNLIHLADSSVSRRHCIVEREAGTFKLLDLGSFNGTFVNGVPIKERVLEGGDQVAVGNILLLFHLQGAGAEAGLSAVELDELEPGTGPMMRIEDHASRYLSSGVTKWGEASERAAQDLSALLKISATLNSVSDVETLRRQLIETVFAAVPAERVAILLARGTVADLDSSFGRHRSSGEGQPIRISRTVAERVLQEGVAISSNDVPRNQAYSNAESLLTSRVCSLLCVPLTTGEKVVGLIYLDTSEPGVRFDEGHVQLLTAVASIASAALMKVQHLEWLKGENQRLHQELTGEQDMIGESPRMREVYQLIARAAPSDSTIMIRGESGTGKELAARAIHRRSTRAAKAFVAINCAVLTETLLESELFGHEKGAFTGAVAQKRGKLEMADGGTLFLDEVAEMTPVMQAKLLRVLQEREFDRVGGTRSVKVDVRVIAATNKNLEEAIAKGTFRQDLYYRLNVVSFVLPPLRERREDIPLLANGFAAKYAKKCKRRIKGISLEARASLSAYDWPGNVRELENAIERAIVLGQTEVIALEDLPDTLIEAGASLKSPMKFYETVKETKKQLIVKAVEQAGGNYTEAARLLGIHPTNLHRLIRTMNLRGPRLK